MARRLVRSLAVSISLAALAAAGGACSKAKEPTTVPPRAAAQVWAEILAQRDAMHALMIKPLEDVTRDDCAQVGAASRKTEELMNELVASLGAEKGQTEGHMRALGDAFGLTGQVVRKIRETALDETPGAWDKLRFPLDQGLRTLETYLTAEQMGGESVTHRPGFEAAPQPPALSPV